MFGRAAERMPLLVVEDRNDAPLVFTLAAVGSVRNSMRVAIPMWVMNSPVHLSIKQHGCDELNARFVLGEIDVLALTGTAPVVEGRQHRDQTETHGDKINIGPKQQHRRLTFAVARQMCEPDNGGQLRSKPALSCAPSGLTLIAGAEHDDVRFYFAQCVVSESEPRHHTLSKVFNHDIRSRNELMCQQHRLRIL